MSERATLLGPGGRPISDTPERLPAPEGHHGELAEQRQESGEFFIYCGRRVAREDLIESPSRHMLPGPGGLLSAVRIRGDLPPWVDFGSSEPAGELAVRPWPGCLPDDSQFGGAAFENVFLRVQLRRNVQVFPWVTIKPGSVIILNWPVISAMGFNLERFGGLAPLWILDRQ